MSRYYKHSADDTEEMMKLSLKYYRFLRDLEAVLGIEITPQQRAQALQLLKDLGEDLKMTALAEVVLQEVKPREE